MGEVKTHMVGVGIGARLLNMRAKHLPERLLEQMRTTFVDNFTKMQGYFSETFTRLFGGGHAELTLMDPEDPLNCGIEVNAQPPGKKLQHISLLSGGERARLAMARMMLEPRNLLVLDEPTNHMDMRSKDILKSAILKYDGTVIVVSHDREFLDGMVDKIYEFRDGGVQEYLGGIYYFLEKRRLASLQEIERRDRPTPAAAPAAAPEGGKQSYEQKKEQEKLLRKLRKTVETIEASLSDLERRIAAYDAKFAAATAYDEADYKAYNDLKAQYDHQMHEWEKASYELEVTEEG